MRCILVRRSKTGAYAVPDNPKSEFWRDVNQSKSAIYVEAITFGPFAECWKLNTPEGERYYYVQFTGREFVVTACTGPEIKPLFRFESNVPHDTADAHEEIANQAAKHLKASRTGPVIEDKDDPQKLSFSATRDDGQSIQVHLSLKERLKS